MKSIDGGKSWFPLDRGLPAGFQPHLLAVSPDENQQIIAASADAVYRSTTGGVAWTRVSPYMPGLTAIHFDVADPRRVLAGTELRGNFQSSDGGVTWTPANRGLPRDRYGFVPGAILFTQDPVDAKHMFMATNGFGLLYRSENGGNSWTPARSGLPEAKVMALAFARTAQPTLFVLMDRGLWRSTDRAATWHHVTGLPEGDLVAMQRDPSTPEGLFVASGRGSLYRSTNGGESWVEVESLPRPLRSFTSWDTATGPVLAAAAAEGVWQLPLWPTLAASPESPARNRAYFQETKHNISPTFYPFFLSRGGVERFGLPRTEEFAEGGSLVQYFQRARLEYRPEHKGTAYEVQISLLGERLLAGRRIEGVEPFESSPDWRYFEETGHSVSNAFLRYFTTRGGVDSLGYPITEELQENGRPVQYFQRGRLEYHAEHAGTRDEVQLGMVGDEILRQRGWIE